MTTHSQLSKMTENLEVLKRKIQERVNNHFESRTEALIDDANYLGDNLTEKEAEQIIKFDLVNNFDKIDADYELTSVYQEDQPELFNFEKQAILELANG
jgi:hypothetical protein